MPGLQTVVRDLRRRKARARRGLAVLEGVRLVEDALAAAVSVRGVFLSDAQLDARLTGLRDQLQAAGAEVTVLGAADFDELADTETPQGVLAVIETPRRALADIDLGGGGVVLVIDGVQDPGNVGALIRTAAGLGAKGTVCLKGTADPWNPKALRAAMGATFRQPVVTVAVAALGSWAAENAIDLWVADRSGDAISDLERPPRLGLVMGNEGAGVSPPLVDASTRRVAISMANDIESLNVGVAAGILLYEVLTR